MPLSPVQGVANISGEYLSSKPYKFVRTLQENTVLNRAFLEVCGAEIPGVLTELIGRNWRTAVEVGFRLTLLMINSLFIPLAFIPFMNKIAAKKNKLPETFTKLFEHQFEYLTPESKIDTFKNKLVEIEGEEKVNKFLGNDSEEYGKKLVDLRKDLVTAKGDVVKMDLRFAGFLTYLVHWTQLWFSKHVLGVVGYTGEMDLLDESQREQSAEFHEKTKYLKFIAGLFPFILGSNWNSNNVKKAALEKEEAFHDKPVLKFIRKNIKQFDYYKQIYANRLNLLGVYVFGSAPGFLLAARSLNELIERCLRMVVFLTTGFWADTWAHHKLAEKIDKKEGTCVIDKSTNKVKTLNQLENELKDAEKGNDSDKAKILLDSIKGQIKLYYQSMIGDAVVMGVGLTAANIIGTKSRVSKGIY